MTYNFSSNTNSNFSHGLSSMMTKVLWRQQQEMLNKHPDGVSIIINEEDPLDIQANIEGPKDTPYEGGIFRIKLVISEDFPQTAPKGFCMTKIYHPNVSEKGEICVNTLKKDWNPKLWSLYNVLEVIKCLLIIPFPESSLNEESGKLFMEDYDRYFKIAKIYTNVHAMPKETNGNKIIDEEMVDHNVYKDNNDCYFNNNISPISFQNNNIEMQNSEPKSDDNYLNYNLLRHAKSVSFKPTYGNQVLRMSDNKNNINNSKFPKFNSFKIENNYECENKINEKPSINSLPFIMRSNSIMNNSENRSNNIPINFNTSLQNGYNNNNMFNGTPNRTKKDEIKKWLSRI